MFGFLFWILFKGSKLAINKTINEPIRNKKIADFKYDKFKRAIWSFEFTTKVCKANEDCIVFRQILTNGVDKIGFFDYSINDYTEKFFTPEGIIKVHRFYFNVYCKIDEYTKSERSPYVTSFDEAYCRETILNLKDKILLDKNFISNKRKHDLM